MMPIRLGIKKTFQDTDADTDAGTDAVSNSKQTKGPKIGTI